MRTKKFLILICLVLLVSISLVAKPTVTLKLVVRSWTKDIIDWATERVQENHPDLNIVVDASFYEYNETRTQLAMRLSRREPIDIMQLDHIWLGEFKNMIKQLDIDDLWGYYNFLPPFREICQRYADPGKTLGFYFSTDLRLIYWNKKLMEELGITNVEIKTWEDVKKYAMLVKEKEDLLPEGVKPVGFMAGPTEHTNSRWYNYLWSAGGDILTPDGKKAAFNSEAGVRALEFYGWFLKNGLVEPADVLSPSSGAVYDESFLKGKFVISLGNGEWLGTWTIYDIGMPLEDFNNTFDAAIIPAPASGGEPGACVAGGYLFSISKFSKNVDLAKEFLWYLTGPIGWNDNSGTKKDGVVTIYSALNTLSSMPFADEIKTALNHAHFRPTIPEYSKISEIIRSAIQEYVMNYNKVSAKEVLDKAAAKVNKILK
ncbi:MAG: extracellular solute-binding protein [Kosmotoga sp.]|uniref:extracellular solute-binding protein n=1 Tax=Kosmotoga sp. TaxID=1955248 RepID=UPI001D250C4C|nr:extracellular solute-binding protein [Kosmotoga sp.]MBO8167301.1 extracellular solute-binding protein [Kosmotoga sp.]